MQRDDLNKFYESAISYLNSDMNDEEQNVFINSLNKDKRLKSLYFQLKDVWEYHQLKDKSSDINLNQMWSEMVNKQPFAFDDNKKKGRSSFLKPVWQIAAAIIVITGLFGVLQFFQSVDENNSLAHVIECDRGDRVKMSLSDGTVVWLNSSSKLEMGQNFSNTNRQLSMTTGEAFFDVKSDSLNPFKIDVAGYQVEVKGTSFNLRYYPEEELFQTSLEEGIVKVHKDDVVFNLEPGDQLNVNTKTGQPELLRNQDMYQVSAWRTGRLEFDNMSMKQLIWNIERWYNHEIIIKDSELYALHFSGVLKHNKSIEHVMKMLSLSHPIRYQIVEDTIYMELIK